MHPDERYMVAAIAQAEQALSQRHYPIGALVVLDEKIVSYGQALLDCDPTGHAEMNAIRQASKELNSPYLKDAWLYTTQEPCCMCTAAALWARMSGIVYGVRGDVAGDELRRIGKNFVWWRISLSPEEVAQRSVDKLEIHGGMLDERCRDLYRKC